MYKVNKGSVKLDGVYYKRGETLPESIETVPSLNQLLREGIIIDSEADLSPKPSPKNLEAAIEDLPDISGYPCAECGFVAKSEQGLKTHMRIHESPGRPTVSEEESPEEADN